jgi:hypothetical protein
MPKKENDICEINEDTIKKLEEAFSFGASDMEACFYAGILLGDFHKYLQANPKFADRREILKQRPVLLARQTVMKAIKDDPKFAMEYLERSGK